MANLMNQMPSTNILPSQIQADIKRLSIKISQSFPRQYFVIIIFTLPEICTIHMMNATPYMHLLVFHIADFIDKYGNVKQFNCQSTKYLTTYLSASLVRIYLTLQVWKTRMMLQKFCTIRKAIDGISSMLQVWKTRMMLQILYHRKSNRWDFTTDLLRDDYIMHKSRVCERPKRKYS